MPLHDWTDPAGWEGVHHYWMTEIARALRAELPPGYRAFIGSSPVLAVDRAPGKPDVAVVSQPTPFGQPAPASLSEPDVEVAVTFAESDTVVGVAKGNRLVAAVELVSPRNKGRPAARQTYTNRYADYLLGGVHLLLVDVHRRPVGFSFPQAIADELEEKLPAGPTPSAVTYRVGGAAATGGRMIAVWHRPMAVGQPLPALPLPLDPDFAVTVPLEPTYARAAADCYLD